MQLNQVDQAFHDTYKQLLAEGHLKESRTGVDILMLPAMTMKFDLSDGALPWPTTRGLRHRQSSTEMKWFISGESSIKYLRDNKNGIWDDWFIKGTDKYDEPTRRHLSTQERVILAAFKGLGADVLRAVKGRLASSGVDGMATLTVPIDAREAVTFNGLAPHCDFPALDKWLDDRLIARTVFLWPATSDSTRLSKDERYDIANGMGLIEGATPLNPDHYPFEMMLDLLGIPERRDVPQPVAFKKRLTRVRNDNTRVWERLCQAFDDNAGGELLDEQIQLWRGNAVVKAVPNEAQRDAMVKILDSAKIPAWPLLDADIGPGAYGPQWRHYKDTQLIPSDEWEMYKKQGYKWVTRINESEEFYDQIVVTREIDQLANVVKQLQTNPDDRRMLVVAWNPGLVWRAALPPCHLYFQFMTTCRPGQDVFDDLIGKDKWKAFAGNCYEDQGVALDEETFVNRFNNDLGFRSYTETHLKWDLYGIPTRDLHCLLVMRSSDTPLGTPFNVAQYSLLTHVIANVCGMQAKSLTWVGGDAHIYVNQVEGIQEQLSRNSHPESDPRITFKRKLKSIDEFTLDDVEFAGYQHRGFIDIPVAV